MNISVGISYLSIATNCSSCDQNYDCLGLMKLGNASPTKFINNIEEDFFFPWSRHVRWVYICYGVQAFYNTGILSEQVTPPPWPTRLKEAYVKTNLIHYTLPVTSNS
jgi:hypothetical protein